MKLADATPLIWLAIFVVVSIAKGWSKMQQSGKSDSSTADDAPPAPPGAGPVVRPRPQLQRPQPQQRPGTVPAPMARPAPRVVPRAKAPTPRGRQVDADGIRRFVEQLSGKPPLPSGRKAEPPPAPPRRPEPVAQAVEPKQPIVPAPVPVQTSRASQWMDALRDRNNVRNIIISAEIIGPPKAESM
jgi:hypothetical protein